MYASVKASRAIHRLRYDGAVMHVRASACRGLPVFAQDGAERLGRVTVPVVQPDTGKIEGFLVAVSSFLEAETLFLATADIAHFGLQIRIRHADLLGPLQDRLRLGEMVASGRTILGQPIVTEGGSRLGRCRDVQFDTHFFQLEWLFPRRMLRWGVPIPARQILEVTPVAVVVRDLPVVVPEDAETIAPLPRFA